MGYAISWIGVRGLKKAAALDVFGFKDTSEVDEYNETPFSAAESGTGWTIIWANDFGFAGDENLLISKSASGQIVACQIEEHVLFSGASQFERGKKVWSISHLGDGSKRDGIFHLDQVGDPPPIFKEILGDLTALQIAEGGRKAEVDYIFDVPLRLAQRLTGFKHDEAGLVFSAVVPG